MNAHTPAPLVYSGHVIADRGDTLSLTDMWKANGADPARAPAEWLRSADAKRFTSFVGDTLNMGISHDDLIKVVRGGRTPGTWAHWQIAFAYAKYLSPEFHMWCNTAAREKMEGRALSPLPDDIIELLRRDDGMLKQVIHKVTVMQKDHADLSTRLHDIENKISSSSTCTANEVWCHYGFGPIKGGTLWLGNRLAEMGCIPEFGGRELAGGQWRRKFDTARAHLAMKNGLKLLTERYIAERRGQGKLPLVQRE